MSITKEKMIETIQEFFGDTRLPRSEVIEGLEEAHSIIEMQLDVLEEEEND